MTQCDLSSGSGPASAEGIAYDLEGGLGVVRYFWTRKDFPLPPVCKNDDGSVNYDHTGKTFALLL